ncbi:MAG: hypothetical protein C5B45_03355 [Chlamydiae bacterium]|nr:MAG: hypothetical protein C5B45_03355 [Chlamydiota bacterium]
MVTLGGVYTSQNHKKSIVKDFQKAKDLLSEKELFSQSGETPSRDAFCTQKIIEKQRVFEGRLINILYDYAPIGPEKVHLLLVPKEHREKFSDLTKEEFLEIDDLSQKLIHFYKDKNPDRRDSAVHVFDKTGALAGQTVPHWHQTPCIYHNQDSRALG